MDCNSQNKRVKHPRKRLKTALILFSKTDYMFVFFLYFVGFQTGKINPMSHFTFDEVIELRNGIEH